MFSGLDYGSKDFECKIDQAGFLVFFIKYLELEFTRVFKNSPMKLTVTKNIHLNLERVKNFYAFEELLSEINASFEDLVGS